MLDPDLTEEALWARMPSLAFEEIPALLVHPATKEHHIAKLLIRRDIPEPYLAQVARSKWAGSLRVQCAIVNHPSTPLALSLNFVKFLFWRDLNAVAQNFHLAADVRHLAEGILFQRLPAMAVGEKVTLARVCGGQVLKGLRREKDVMVIQALLENPRMVEEDVLYLVNQPRTPAPVLEAVARDPRWATRREVKIALLRNAKTPLSVALAFISSLNAVDLGTLVHDAKVPLAIRRVIERKLGKHP